MAFKIITTRRGWLAFAFLGTTKSSLTRSTNCSALVVESGRNERRGWACITIASRELSTRKTFIFRTLERRCESIFARRSKPYQPPRGGRNRSWGTSRCAKSVIDYLALDWASFLAGFVLPSNSEEGKTLNRRREAPSTRASQVVGGSSAHRV